MVQNIEIQERLKDLFPKKYVEFYYICDCGRRHGTTCELPSIIKMGCTECKTKHTFCVIEHPV